MSEWSKLTLRQACVLVVAMLGGEPTTTQVHEWLALDGWGATRDSVRATLEQLAAKGGARIEPAAPQSSGRPTRWRLTGVGRAWLAEADGEFAVAPECDDTRGL